MTEDQVRARLGEILTDYKDGLLDSLEDGVDAIMAIEPIAAALKLTPVRSGPPLGHSISTRGPTDK